MKTTIILQRHCQSLANQEHIYAGHSDFDLSQLGFKQARICAELIRDKNIDAIYSSDLKRAFNTAKAHADIRGLSVIPSVNLREMYLGEWEAGKVADLHEKYPYEATYIWQNFFGIFRAAGGESAPAVAERIYKEILRIAKDNVGKTVLISSHAAAIRLFWGKISEIAPEDLSKNLPFPTNGSFSTLEFDGERLIPVKYSSDDHISDAKSAPIDA